MLFTASVLLLVLVSCCLHVHHLQVCAWIVTRPVSRLPMKESMDSMLSVRIVRTLLTSSSAAIFPLATSSDVLNSIVHNRDGRTTAIKQILSLEDQQLRKLLTPRVVKVLLAASVSSGSEDLIRPVLQTLHRINILTPQLIYISIHLAIKNDDTVKLAYTILTETYAWHYKVDPDLMQAVFKKLLATKHISNALELIDQFTANQNVFDNLIEEREEISANREAFLDFPDDEKEEVVRVNNQGTSQQAAPYTRKAAETISTLEAPKKPLLDQFVKPWRQVMLPSVEEIPTGHSVSRSAEVSGEILHDPAARQLLINRLLEGDASLWRQMVYITSQSMNTKQLVELSHVFDDAMLQPAKRRSILLDETLLTSMLEVCRRAEDVSSILQLVLFAVRYGANCSRNRLDVENNTTLLATQENTLDAVWEVLRRSKTSMPTRWFHCVVDTMLAKVSTTEKDIQLNQAINTFMKRLVFLCFEGLVDADATLLSLLIDYFATTALNYTKKSSWNTESNTECLEMCNMILNIAFQGELVLSPYALVQYQEVLQSCSDSLLTFVRSDNKLNKNSRVEHALPLLKIVSLFAYCSNFQLILPHINSFPLYWEMLLKLPPEQSATIFMLLVDELVSYEDFMQRFMKSMDSRDTVKWRTTELQKDILQPVPLDFMAKVLHLLRLFDEHNKLPEMKEIQQRMLARIETWVSTLRNKHNTLQLMERSSLPVSSSQLIYPLCPVDIFTLLDAFLSMSQKLPRHATATLSKLFMSYIQLKFPAQGAHMYDSVSIIKDIPKAHPKAMFPTLQMSKPDMVKYTQDFTSSMVKHLSIMDRILQSHDFLDMTSIFSQLPQLSGMLAPPLTRKLLLIRQSNTNKSSSDAASLQVLNAVFPVKTIGKSGKTMIFVDLSDQLTLAQITLSLLSPQEAVILAEQSKEQLLAQAKQFYEEEMSQPLRKRTKEIQATYPNATIKRLAALRSSDFPYHVKSAMVKETVLIDFMLILAILAHDQHWMQLILADCKSMESSQQHWYADHDEQTLNLFLLALLQQYIDTYNFAGNIRKVKNVIEQVLYSVTKIAPGSVSTATEMTNPSRGRNKHNKHNSEKQTDSINAALYTSERRTPINYDNTGLRQEIVAMLKYFKDAQVSLHPVFDNVTALLQGINSAVPSEDLIDIILPLEQLPRFTTTASLLSTARVRERIQQEVLPLEAVEQHSVGSLCSPIIYRDVYNRNNVMLGETPNPVSSPAPSPKKGFGLSKQVPLPAGNSAGDVTKERDSLIAKFHPGHNPKAVQYITFPNAFSGMFFPFSYLVALQYYAHFTIQDMINLRLLDQLQSKLFPNTQ